jgi:hypothetical protein
MRCASVLSRRDLGSAATLLEKLPIREAPQLGPSMKRRVPLSILASATTSSSGTAESRRRRHRHPSNVISSPPKPSRRSSRTSFGFWILPLPELAHSDSSVNALSRCRSRSVDSGASAVSCPPLLMGLDERAR